MIVTIGHFCSLCDCVEIPLEDLASLTHCSSCCKCDPQRPTIAIAVSRLACRVSGDWHSRVSTPRCSLGPNDRLQADLVDFSQNTRGANKFALVLTDIFTERWPGKSCPTSGPKPSSGLRQRSSESNYVITTSMDNEFRDRASPKPSWPVSLAIRQLRNQAFRRALGGVT